MIQFDLSDHRAPQASRRLLHLSLLLAIGGTVVAAELPSGLGLAAKYPRDEKIARDPAVVLHEDFEAGDLSALKAKWSDISNKDGKPLALSEENPKASGGKHSLQITSTLGQDSGGHLYTRLPRELETAFARFYVRFDEDAQHVHHFVHLGGYRPATSYAQGGAGERPRGDERFTVGIEPYGARGRFPAPGAWTFYAYWPEMKVSADGKYWGAAIPSVTPAPVPRGRWQCVEMLKVNSTSTTRDGELALWLDGQLTSHICPGTARGEWTGMGFQPLAEGGTPFEGFRWRTDERLRVNFFWLLFYVTENAARQNNIADPPKVNRVWFDDIVVASEYIGPTSP